MTVTTVLTMSVMLMVAWVIHRLHWASPAEDRLQVNATRKTRATVQAFVRAILSLWARLVAVLRIQSVRIQILATVVARACRTTPMLATIVVMSGVPFATIPIRATVAEHAFPTTCLMA